MKFESRQLKKLLVLKSETSRNELNDLTIYNSDLS